MRDLGGAYGSDEASSCARIEAKGVGEASDDAIPTPRAVRFRSVSSCLVYTGAPGKFLLRPALLQSHGAEVHVRDVTSPAYAAPDRSFTGPLPNRESKQFVARRDCISTNWSFNDARWLQRDRHHTGTHAIGMSVAS